MQVASLIENIGATKINTYHKEFKKSKESVQYEIRFFQRKRM